MSEKKPATNTATQPHHTVVSLRVTGGFLGGAHLDFADGLNCLIGGRGTGKTTALEFLRFGLGLMPDPKVDLQRCRLIDGLVKANLGGGRVNIEVRTKMGMRYTAGRGVNETVQVLNENGVAVPISLDRDHIFGADVFSQNEIEEIASSPAAQLDLLDRFRDQDTDRIARELEQLQQELGRSAAAMRRLDQEIEDLRGKAAEAPVLEERLKGLATVAGPDAAKLNAAHEAKGRRSREVQLPELAVAALDRLERDIMEAQSAFIAAIGSQVDQSLRDGANREVLELLEADLQAFVKELADSVGAIRNAARTAGASVRRRSAALAERHAIQESEYRALLARSEEEGGRTTERMALQTSLADAQGAVNELQAREKQRGELTATRKLLLNRASELRDRRFELRKGVAERLTRQFASLRVTVAQAADLGRYREMLVELLKGAGVKQGPVADRLSQALLPTELAHIVASSDQRALMERSDFDADRVRRILDALRSSGGAYDIEMVDLEDRPCIELRDGAQFKESPHLSTGQRCTTILPILLVQSERPLLIDQPEDNLDNAFVYETIVTALRAVKGSRQVIFVTHNPNIPVLGEAERVFVFASDGEHAAIRQAGTVDECKDEIERILEGGREAFLERKTRYGH